MGSITWQYAAAGALAVVWLLLLLRRLGLPSWRRARRETQAPVWMSIVGWLLIAVLVAATAGGGLLSLLGWPKLPKQAAFSTTEMLDLLKIGLAVVAGFGGVVALAVNYRKQRVTEAAHEHSLNQEERERTKLFNERFKVAAELLNGDQTGLRIAGVSAMAGLADDWEAQRQTCVDALIDQLRLQEDDGQTTNKILRALRDRLGTHREAGPWSELNFDFTGVLFVDADFSERTFAGAVIFDGAEFTGDNTSFERTAFRDTVFSCHGTTFTGTEVNFQDASFMRGAIEFVGCTFDRTTLNMRGMEAVVRGFDFYRCTFTSSSIIGKDTVLSPIRVELCRLVDSTIDVRADYDPDAQVVRLTNNTVVSGEPESSPPQQPQ
ncbi:hypothetical protein [Lentzea sp. NPDC051838]|uniref:hypothetical protein n=1 Tax=Lentzea sp. NPDC051838 TaxID=3154849 RepID=UPI00343C17D7